VTAVNSRMSCKHLFKETKILYISGRDMFYKKIRSVSGATSRIHEGRWISMFNLIKLTYTKTVWKKWDLNCIIRCLVT